MRVYFLNCLLSTEKNFCEINFSIKEDIMEERETRSSDWPTEMGRNAYGEWEFGDILGTFVSAVVQDIAFLLVENGKGKIDEEGGILGGVDFQNSVFEMHPYHWGRCTCGAGVGQHDQTCAIKRPNFRFGDLELRWYHVIGPGMTANRPTSRQEFREIYRRCLDSLR